MEIQLHELAKRTGLTKDTIRYYVKIGLLQPKRNLGNGYKLFNQKDAIRLRFICKAKFLGFTLKEIQQIILECEQGRSPCSMVREFLSRHIAANKKYLQEHNALQERMEIAWEKWQEMPDSQSKHDEYCAMIESVVNAGFAVDNANQTMGKNFPATTASASSTFTTEHLT